MVLLSFPRLTKTLSQLKGRTPFFEKEAYKHLPLAYQTFYKEWKFQRPSPVYYIPEEGRYKPDPETTLPQRVVNVPLPLQWVPEMENMLMGGEAIVKGCTQAKPLRRRVPHWWVPTLRRTVVYSEVLDQYMPVIATNRLIELVHEHKGFDNYILDTPACDLRSNLAVKIKRRILITLANKDCYPDDAKKQQSILEKYQKHIMPAEEADWFGLTLKEAMVKYHVANAVEAKPLKQQYRQELLEYLKGNNEISIEDSPDSSSWLKKVGSKLSLTK